MLVAFKGPAHLFKRDNPKKKNTNLLRRGIKIKLDMYGNYINVFFFFFSWLVLSDEQMSKRYEPPGETYSIRVSRIVKQIRRLQSLLVRLDKYPEDHLPVHIKSQNAKEWHVIKNAYGIGKTFREYVMFELLIPIWYDDNPPIEWLENLCASLKIHVDCLVKKESQCRRKQFQHDVTLDTLYFGSSLCHAMIKSKKQEVVALF